MTKLHYRSLKPGLPVKIRKPDVRKPCRRKPDRRNPDIRVQRSSDPWEVERREHIRYGESEYSRWRPPFRRDTRERGRRENRNKWNRNNERRGSIRGRNQNRRRQGGVKNKPSNISSQRTQRESSFFSKFVGNLLPIRYRPGNMKRRHIHPPNRYTFAG